MNKKLFAIAFGVLAMFACNEPEPEPTPQGPELPVITLSSPEDGIEYDLNAMSEALAFGWVENEEINSYRLQFSLTPDFEVMESVSTKGNPSEVGIVEMDEVLGLLGLRQAKSAYVYWRVAPLRSDEFECEPFKVFMNRLDPRLRVIAPVNGMRYNLDEQKTSIAFEWKPALGAEGHSLQFCANQGFSTYKEPYKLGAKDSRLSLSPAALDNLAGELGIDADATGDIYWRVVPTSSKETFEPYPARKITVERKYPYIRTIAPEANTVVDLEDVEKVAFSWDKSGVSKFFFDMALNEDFSDLERADVGNKTSYEVSAATIDAMLDKGGVMPGSNGVVYWRVSPQAGSVQPSETKVLIAKRVNTGVELIEPLNKKHFTCTHFDEIYFEWGAVEGITNFNIEFADNSNFDSPVKYNVTTENSEDKTNATNVYIHIDWFDAMLGGWGVEEFSTGKVYWRVVPQGDHDKEITSRNFTFERKDPAMFLPYEERLFDQKKTIYVEVLYEDPIVSDDRLKADQQNKRLSQVTTIHGNRWREPMNQLLEYEAALEEAAHGLIDWVVVAEHKMWEDDRFAHNELPYSYYIDKNGRPSDENGKTLPAGSPNVTLKYNKYLEWCLAKDPPGLNDRVNYDYIKMLTDPRLATDGKTIAERVDLGLVQEVWVMNGPVSGLNESKLIGDGAFWCNSVGLTKEMGAPCTKLVCVMGSNFERSTDLGVHCWGHRYESIMSEVYKEHFLHNGEFKQFYDNRYKESQLCNWERFCGYKMNYGNGKFPEQEGYAHIGFCHFPPNGVNDYDYYLQAYFNTYADEWLEYPRIRMNKRKARRVNREEWGQLAEEAEDKYQMGYMIWYLGHMPHFKGLNMEDGHLNNWWYYVVDIKGALEYEAQLRKELGWQSPYAN